jgi:hypothetical protein
MLDWCLAASSDGYEEMAVQDRSAQRADASGT